LVRRNRGNGKFAKLVQAVTGTNPNVPLAILQHILNRIAGKTVRLREYIGPSLVHMEKPPAAGSNPQTAVAIAQQELDGKRLAEPGEWIRLAFPVNETLDSFTRADQERAVVGLIETLDRLRKEYRRTGFPAPQPAFRSGPEIAIPVLK